jgi:hypothetical protein
MRPLQSFAQLLQGNARCVGGQDRVRPHPGLDAGIDLALEIEHLGHRFDYQIGGAHPLAGEIGQQAIERIAHIDAPVRDPVEQFRGASDRSGERLRLHVGERHGEAVPGAPGRDVAPHGARPDDVNALAVPGAVGERFQLFPQPEHADQVLRGGTGDELRERGDLGFLHRLRIAAIGLPGIDQRVGSRIVRGRRFGAGLRAHALGGERAGGRELEHRHQELRSARLQFAGDRRSDGGAHMALLRHRIDQAERLRPAGAGRSAGEHHGHGLDRIDKAGRPHRAAEAGMQAEQHLGKSKARILDRDPEITGERDLEPAAQAIAVDHRDSRKLQPIQPVHDGVGAHEARRDVGGVLGLAQLAHIGAGDEAGRLARAQHQPLGGFALDLAEHVIELGEHLLRERVGAGAALVEHEPENVILVPPQLPMPPGADIRAAARSLALPRKRGREIEGAELQIARLENFPNALRHGRPHTVSINMAPPCPPPMHSVAIPRFRPSRFMALTR